VLGNKNGLHVDSQNSILFPKCCEYIRDSRLRTAYQLRAAIYTFISPPIGRRSSPYITLTDPSTESLGKKLQDFDTSVILFLKRKKKKKKK
jgi:hypothetical protein